MLAGCKIVVFRFVNYSRLKMAGGSMQKDIQTAPFHGMARSLAVLFRSGNIFINLTGMSVDQVLYF